MGKKADKTPKIINEIAYFSTPGETHGWTGEGEILPDDPTGDGPVNRWFSTEVQRDFGIRFPRQTTVRVVIRLRGELPNETLQCAGLDGEVQEMPNIEPVKPALYEFYLLSSRIGEFRVAFKLASKRKMVIQNIQVQGPWPPAEKT